MYDEDGELEEGLYYTYQDGKLVKFEKKEQYDSPNYKEVYTITGDHVTRTDKYYNDEYRGSEEIDVEQFISVKGYKAKGKRLTTFQVASIVELEPTRFPEPPEETEETEEEEENLDPDAGKSQQQVRDELTGQLNLFPDE